MTELHQKLLIQPRSDAPCNQTVIMNDLERGSCVNPTERHLSVVELHNKFGKRGSSSLLWSVFNLTNTIVGSGTLTLPFVLRSGGYLGANILMLIIASLTWYSVRVLINASNLLDHSIPKTYEGLGWHILGRPGLWVAEATFIFGGFGTVCSYFVFCTQLFFAVTHLDTWWHPVVTLAMGFGVVMPLSLFRSISKLRFVSLMAVASVVYLVCFVLGAAIADPIRPHVPEAKPFSISDQSVFMVTLLIGAFCCHNTALPVYEELHDRSTGRMGLVVAAALALTFLIYECIGLSGYLLFGSATEENILLNFDQDFLSANPDFQWPVRMAALSMLICLLLSAPVALWPFRSCVLSVVLRVKHGRQMDSADATSTELRVTTLTAIATIVGAAILTPNVRTPLGLVGSLAGSLIIFILPALFYLRQQSDQRVLAVGNMGPYFLLAIGVLLAPVSFSLTLMQLF